MASDGDNIVWGTAERRRQHRVGHVDRRRQHRLGHQRRRRRDLGQQRRRRRRVVPGRRNANRCRVSTSSSATWCRSVPVTSSRSSSISFRSEASNHGKDALPTGTGRSRALQRDRRASPKSDTRSPRTGAKACRCWPDRRSRLRELRASDAPSLFALLTTEEVSRFISPPPTTVEGFERFIAWTLRQRQAGTYACFAVTLDRTDTAIGIFQLRELEPGFGTAEWGFAIGSAYWGTGVFQEGAELMIKFAFETVGVHRLEARAAVKNGRGNGALRKIGAVQEGCSASRSSRTVSISIRRSGRSSTRTGSDGADLGAFGRRSTRAIRLLVMARIGIRCAAMARCFLAARLSPSSPPRRDRRRRSDPRRHHQPRRPRHVRLREDRRHDPLRRRPEGSAQPIVVDLDKAPVNAAGRVEFSSDLYILRPKAPRGNGAALVDILNRGNKVVAHRIQPRRRRPTRRPTPISAIAS